MPGVALIPFLQALLAVGSGLAAVKLYATGLFRKYRLLFGYLLFCVPGAGLPLFLQIGSGEYFVFYVITQPVLWFFYVGMVLELFGLALERHKGFYTLGRRAMGVGLAAAVTVSALTFLPDITPQSPQGSDWGMGLMVAVERGLNLSLAIFLILMLLFLAAYTAPLSRNVLAHAVVFTIYFLSNSMGMILRTVFGLKYASQVDAALLAASCGGVLAWLILLTRKGEEVHPRLPWFGPVQEEHILNHLDSLNEALLRASRKQRVNRG